jgi:hypothetical protein
MNGQFDLVVSETRSAALRVLSLIGRHVESRSLVARGPFGAGIDLDGKPRHPAIFAGERNVDADAPIQGGTAGPQ